MLDVTKPQSTAPFDTARLDRLMDDAGIDVLVATSKHNVQYLLGGHRSFFFDNMDAIGISRYLPVFVYPKGAPEKAGYFGHGMETYQTQIKPFWVSEVSTKSGGSVDVMQKAADYVRGLKPKPAHRRRARIPTGRFRGRTAQGNPRRGDQGCAVRARTLARAQNVRRSWRSCGSRPTSSSIRCSRSSRATAPAPPRRN